MFPVSCFALETDPVVIYNLLKDKKYTQAKESVTALIEKQPANAYYYQILSDIYILQNKFDDAVLTCYKMLDYEPANVYATINLAHIYSWTGRFKNSLEYYDKIIALDPENLDYRLEKCRVLAWSGAQKTSLDLYFETFKRFRFEWIYDEMKAKEFLWNRDIKNAIFYYKKSIASNGANTETLFDLAQLYSYLGMHAEAVPYYEKLLAVNPYHSAGIKSRNRNTAALEKIKLSAGYNTRNADSAERLTDAAISTVFLSVEKKVHNIYTLGFTHSRNNYVFFDSTGPADNSISFSFAFKPGYMYGMGLRAGQLNYDTKINPRNSYEAFFWFKTLQNLDTLILYKKENLLNNSTAILSDYNAVSALLKLTYDMDKHFLFNAEYKNGEIDKDKNSFTTAALEAKYTLFPAPACLYFTARAENQKYSSVSSVYFAPSNYNTISALAGFKHNLGKDGLYYGAKDIYYELTYKITADNNNQSAVNPSLGLYADLAQNLNLKISHSITDSPYYKDNTSSFLVTWQP
ncbi:MAG: hypothetical protein A2252_11155 [Elusimicrobia bacterium RIFOXYA2_FULL_39_19]|nr:MAG: hypothetical protein A2252_11155 [Elusimicrobia bacterium RIFOXYA2_FULL_39_19]